jgi:hypothetical protein
MVEVILTNHLVVRFLDRGFDISVIIRIAKNGKIVKTEPDGTIVVIGKDYNGRNIKVALIQRGRKIIVKSAFYENNL